MIKNYKCSSIIFINIKKKLNLKNKKYTIFTQYSQNTENFSIKNNILWTNKSNKEFNNK